MKTRMPVCVGLIAALVSACGGGDDSSQATTTTQPTQPPVTTAPDQPGPDTSDAAPPPTSQPPIAQYDGWELGLPTMIDEPDGCGVIGVQFPTMGVGTILIQERAMRRQAEKLGGEVVMLDDEVNPTQQVANTQQLLDRGVDALTLWPLDPSAVVGIMGRAASEGVPVVVQDLTHGEIPADTPPFAIDVAQNWDRGPHDQMQFIAEQSPGAKVGIIGLSVPVPGINYAAERQAYWAEQFGLEVAGVALQGTDDIDGSSEAMRSLLAAHPDMNAVVGYNDPTTIGAATAAKSAGRDMISVGLNSDDAGIETVRSGLVTATFQADYVVYGIALVNALCTLSLDPDAVVPERIVRTIAGPVTAENVDQLWKTEEQQVAEAFG